jgi:hypothetical protein
VATVLAELGDKKMVRGRDAFHIIENAARVKWIVAGAQEERRNAYRSEVS